MLFIPNTTVNCAITYTNIKFWAYKLTITELVKQWFSISMCNVVVTLSCLPHFLLPVFCSDVH